MNASSPVILNNIVKDDRRALLWMYRWLCREVWRDGFFACEGNSAALLRGLQITDLHGVIRILQTLRIYGVQILKCASLYFRVQMLPIYRLQILGLFMMCRLRRYRCLDYGWQCHEVWRDGFFACKVASAALLHGIADRMECSSVSFLYYSMIFGHKTVVFR